MLKTAFRHWLFGSHNGACTHEAATIAADSAIIEARALAHDLMKMGAGADPFSDLVRNVKSSNGYHYRRHSDHIVLARTH